jgi:hypothetical protein
MRLDGSHNFARVLVFLMRLRGNVALDFDYMEAPTGGRPAAQNGRGSELELELETSPEVRIAVAWFESESV